MPSLEAQAAARELLDDGWLDTTESGLVLADVAGVIDRCFPGYQKMCEVLKALPLNSFGSDMGAHDAAEFVDHAGEFFEAMCLAKKAVAERAASTQKSILPIRS